MTDSAPDVVVVGGGIVGSATAYHVLLADPTLDVVVLEKDRTYRYASTTLCEGNVRVQFNLPENIRMSLYTLELLERFEEEMAVGDFRPDAGARHQGNLFLAAEENVAEAKEGLERQHALGCDEVVWLDPGEIASRFPPLTVEGLAGGTFGPRDGTVNPSGLLEGFRRQAEAMGARFVEEEVLGLRTERSRVEGVETSSGAIEAGETIVVAGAWTPDLLRPIGIDLPVAPTMRSVFVVSTPFPSDGMSCLFLPSGAYAIPEGGATWLIGRSFPDDPVGFDFTPAPRSRFEEGVWPQLVEHLPLFEQLKVERSWAGLYAVNTMDGNAIIGRWPGLDRLSFATGFSGHGFQHGPAMGRYLSELVLGTDHELDLRRFGPERVIAGAPLPESATRLI